MRSQLQAAAAHSAAEALRLARLAVALAEKAPGTERWRLRLLGYCEPFVANALRVGGTSGRRPRGVRPADDHGSREKAAIPLGLLDATAGST